MKKNTMLSIIGPTACGKTTLAVHLAHHLDGEVISADSRQVYKGMDIGTGKDLDEYVLQGNPVPYHLIDIIEPGTQYNVFDYQQDFHEAYHAIRQAGKLPVLCGGSGMYIEAVLKGYELTKVPVNEALRKELEGCTMSELEARLTVLKTTHNRSDLDTPKRAIRAIEIAEHQNSTACDIVKPQRIDSMLVGIHIDREERRKRIEQRLRTRLKDGLVEEVEALMQNGLTKEQLLYYGLEYKWVTLYLVGEIDYETMFDRLLIAIHQFAKRQMTWFRKMEKSGFSIHWLDGLNAMDDMLNEIQTLLHEELNT